MSAVSFCQGAHSKKQTRCLELEYLCQTGCRILLFGLNVPAIHGGKQDLGDEIRESPTLPQCQLLYQLHFFLPVFFFPSHPFFFPSLLHSPALQSIVYVFQIHRIKMLFCGRTSISMTWMVSMVSENLRQIGDKKKSLAFFSIVI